MTHYKTIEQALQEAARHMHPAYKQHEALTALRELHHQTESAEYWHKLYIDKCRQMNDAVAILGAEIEALELAAVADDATQKAYEPDIIAQYDEAYAATHGSQRQWYSVGAWLYEGDAIAVISGATKKE